jgi:hypothetical protein
MTHVSDFDGFLNENEIKETNELYTLKETSYGGKPTWTLTLTLLGWEHVERMFDKDGRPLRNNLKQFSVNGYRWELRATHPLWRQGNNTYARMIYGVCGDYTFGAAPMTHPESKSGNKRAAKQIFDEFIKKYL